MKTTEEIGTLSADRAKCRIAERLTKCGLSRTYYMTKIKELCEATRTISCINKGEKDKDAGGGTVDYVDVPDYQTQLGAIKILVDLYGDKAALKVDQKHDGIIEIVTHKYIPEITQMPQEKKR